VLAPGGFFVLCVFGRRFPLFQGSRRPWHIAQGAYRRYFAAGEIRRLFGADFEILELAVQKDGGGFWHVLMRRSSI
jgi:hypothetical protein